MTGAWTTTQFRKTAKDLLSLMNHRTRHSLAGALKPFLQDRLQFWLWQRPELTVSTISDRKGYRTEVRKWMEQKGIKSLPEAAKRLALSESALKSIMSSKGSLRYGKETLQRVLREIGQGKE